MTTLGLLAAIPMGVSLGFLGGGGSILALPILVYLFGMEPTVASGYSLLIVGATAFVPSLTHLAILKRRFNQALFFALPSTLAVYSVRSFILPSIPDEIAQIGPVVVEKNNFIMILFSVVIITTAVVMLRKAGRQDPSPDGEKHRINIVSSGLGEGVISGIVGAGGGFLIVPALTLFGRFPIKDAIATSIAIIAVKSLLGFIGDIQNGIEFHREIVFIFLPFTITGSLVGSYFSKRVNSTRLKQIFAISILLMGLTILFTQTLS